MLRILWYVLSRAFNTIVDVRAIYRKHIASKTPKVLEVATGFGINTWALLEFLKSVGGVLTSVDIDSKAIRRARKIFRRYVEEGILSLDVVDARSLPYNSGSFDYIVSHMTMHHINDIEAALDEMLRVLKPGGKIIIVDLNPTIIMSMIPEHGKKKLSSVRSRVIKHIWERLSVIDHGDLRFSYYIVAQKQEAS
ncbi:MAG TPA: class I SAM-dependent methyltransferase [Sulfolobales archaeon]|nr:class I SAM-dependent methyltransferase [Sulfolobales archaeon]